MDIPLWRSLKLNTHYRQDEQNLDLNPSLPSAPRRKNYQVGLSYNPGRGTKLSLDYWNRTREDRLPGPNFNYSEETVRLALGHTFRNVSLWASAEGGEKRDRLTDETGPLQQYSLSASWAPTRGQSYRAYVQYQQNGFSHEDWRRITGGVNASFQLGPNTSLGLNYQRSQYEGAWGMERDQIDLEFGHRFPNHHELSVRGRYASYDNSYRQDEMAVMVGYGIPFGVPVSRKTSTGILKGRVYDAENPPRGLARVLVRLNDLTAVTDRNGEFTFGSLRPGTYYLTLDRESIGMDRVTVQKSPLPVTVLAGKKNRIEVGVTRGATVSGRVMLFPPLGKSSEDKTTSPRSAANSAPPGILASAPDTALGATTETPSAETTDTVQPEPYGLANVLVELSNPSETLRRLTDRKGRFLFEDVRPGTWTLKVHEAGLPENHCLEQDTFTFELKPGETKEVLARVLLKKRPIRIIEEGGVIEEEQ